MDSHIVYSSKIKNFSPTKAVVPESTPDATHGEYNKVYCSSDPKNKKEHKMIFCPNIKSPPGEYNMIYCSTDLKTNPSTKTGTLS